jgi:hypothetical protein
VLKLDKSECSSTINDLSTRITLELPSICDHQHANALWSTYFQNVVFLIRVKYNLYDELKHIITTNVIHWTIKGNIIITIAREITVTS